MFWFTGNGEVVTASTNSLLATQRDMRQLAKLEASLNPPTIGVTDIVHIRKGGKRGIVVASGSLIHRVMFKDGTEANYNTAELVRVAPSLA